MRRVCYLVGGLRISLDADSTTPGPKSHVEHFTHTLACLGNHVEVFLANDVPGLRRFKRVSEGSAIDKKSYALLASDVIRIGAAIWSGAALYISTFRAPRPDIVYERVAVFQSLASFHPAKTRSVRIVESNGLMARETAQDRNAIYLERLASALEKRVYRKADIIVAVSLNLAKQIEEFSQVPSDKIIVVPNAIPAQLRSIERMVTNEFIIGFSGAIVQWQQLDKLIRAFAQCCDRDKALDDRAVLEIIGDGPVKEELQILARELGVASKVRFIRRLPQADLFLRMSRWHVGYAGHQKSSSNSMYHSPLKIYEYAGLGLSVICTRTPDAAALESDGLKTYYFDDLISLTSAILDSFVQRDNLSDAEDVKERLHRRHGWPNRINLVLDAVDNLVKS